MGWQTRAEGVQSPLSKATRPLVVSGRQDQTESLEARAEQSDGWYEPLIFGAPFVQTWSGCTTIPTYDNDYRDPTKSDLWHYLNEHLEIDEPVVCGPYTIVVDGKPHTYQAVDGENPAMLKTRLLVMVLGESNLIRISHDLCVWVRTHRHLIQKSYRAVSRNRSPVPV